MKKPTVIRTPHSSLRSKGTSAGEGKLGAKVLEETFAGKVAKRLAAHKCLPPDVLAYLVNTGDQKTLEAIRSHTRKCDSCQKSLQEFEEGLKQKGTLDLDIHGSADQGRFKISEEVLTMIVKAGRRYHLELVDCSGEVVSNIPGPVKDTRSGESSGNTVIVKKQMPSYDLSIQVAMSGTTDATRYEARFCAMKPDIDKYIEDLGVSLTTKGKDIAQKRTDEKGCAEFDGMTKGNYEIWAGDKLIASIVIK